VQLHEALKQNPYIGQLSDENLDRVGALMTLTTYTNGEVLIAEDDIDDTVHLLLEGTVSITRQGDVVGDLQPGAFFGLLALIDPAPRAATVTATSDVVSATLSRHNYHQLVNQAPEIALAFQQTIGAQLAQDFRNVIRQVDELLNVTAEPQTPIKQYDVAVIGAGPIGLFYAQSLSRFRPGTRIAVIERKSQPTHKVGESTLSTTTRSFVSMGLPHPVLRRLFGNKAGLRWFHTSSETDLLDMHFDIVDLEETYQVERRVLETALQYTTSKFESVDLFTSTRVLIRESTLSGEMNELLCADEDDEQFLVRARVVCDASGPASVIPRHLNLYRKAPEMLDTLNYNSYFAYFRPRKKVPIDFWDYPATRHICFKEGWLWFISLNSWESNPQDKLEAMIKYLIDLPQGADEEYPTRDELAAMFDLTYEPMFSIGFTIRDDMDVKDMRIQERFDHYVRKYPAIAWVLDHFELVEAPYEGKQRAHFAFMNMLHDVEQAAGDGWCAIGDAAVFVNPFISPGLNYGTGTAYMAARATAEGLNKGDVSRAAFADYEEYAAAVYRQKAQETDMYHRSFAHPKSFERALAVSIAWAVTDVIVRGDTYSETDPYVFDFLNPLWVAIVKEVADIQRAGERNGTDPSAVADQVEETVNDFIASLKASHHLDDLPIGNYQRFYDNNWQRSDGPRYEKDRGDFEARQCGQCSLFYDDTLQRCPYCGAPNPAPHIVKA
jgi:flavin-dependent dehydrogenase/CRP-like cAMP-binding protein